MGNHCIDCAGCGIDLRASYGHDEEACIAANRRDAQTQVIPPPPLDRWIDQVMGPYRQVMVWTNNLEIQRLLDAIPKLVRVAKAARTLSDNYCGEARDQDLESLRTALDGGAYDSVVD